MHLENITLLEKLNLLEKQSEHATKLANSNSDSFLIEDKPVRVSYLEVLENNSTIKNSPNLNNSEINQPNK